MATIHKPFTYVPAIQTDIRKTIAKARKRLQAEEEARQKAEADSLANVQPINAAKTSNDRATVASGDALASGGTTRRKTA